MEEIGLLMQGFAVALQPDNILLMLLGVSLGVLIGVLPGLGGANGIAILLPLTFAMPPVSAIIMLSCIYWGALFGGAITSILFNIPGEPWSVATTFDGYPMAQQGRAGAALTAAVTAPSVGAPRPALPPPPPPRRPPHGPAGPRRRGADGRLHRVLRRRFHRRGAAHLPGAAGGGLRAPVRPAAVLRGDVPVLRLLHRPRPWLAAQDPRRHDARLPSGDRGHGHGDGPAPHDLRLDGDDPRLRLPRRRHRPVRHLRDPGQ